jgi:hypothetical protein
VPSTKRERCRFGACDTRPGQRNRQRDHPIDRDPAALRCGHGPPGAIVRCDPGCAREFSPVTIRLVTFLPRQRTRLPGEHSITAVELTKEAGAIPVSDDTHDGLDLLADTNALEGDGQSRRRDVLMDGHVVPRPDGLDEQSGFALECRAHGRDMQPLIEVIAHEQDEPIG